MQIERKIDCKFEKYRKLTSRSENFRKIHTNRALKNLFPRIFPEKVYIPVVKISTSSVTPEGRVGVTPPPPPVEEREKEKIELGSFQLRNRRRTTTTKKKRKEVTEYVQRKMNALGVRTHERRESLLEPLSNKRAFLIMRTPHFFL
jgi:hypothetical protein